MAGCVSTSCISRRRRGGGRVENFSRLAGLRISFEMPRIMANGLFKEGNIARGISTSH